MLAQRHPIQHSGTQHLKYTKDMLTGTTKVLAQDFILVSPICYNDASTEQRICYEIWRLYTVFMYNWKITIIPVSKLSPSFMASTEVIS